MQDRKKELEKSKAVPKPEKRPLLDRPKEDPKKKVAVAPKVTKPIVSIPKPVIQFN